jgi:dihydroxy-acid dehydratase
MPSGKYLMEEFFYAGGLPAVIKRLGEAGLLHRDALTVSGETAWEQVRDAQNHNDDVILPVEKALAQSGGIAVVRGNLAPNGAVLKPSAATPSLMVHRGRAVVFEDIDDYKAKINDEALDIDETCVMVSRTAGPRAIRAWPRSGTWACRPRSCARASPTWCASRTRGCRGRPTDRGAPHLARGGGRRARWRSCRTAT